MGKSVEPPLMDSKPSRPLRGQNLLKPGPESSTDFFPSPNYQGICQLCVPGGLYPHTNSTDEREFRQTFAHAILKYYMPPVKQDGNEQG